MLSLLALWAALLLLGFALLQWGLRTSLARPEEERWFTSYLYLSGSSLFTMGAEDTTPVNTLGSALMIVEAGTGFGVLALLEPATAEGELGRVRELYEPYCNALAGLLLVPLPPWNAPPDEVDNWRKSAWQKRAPVAIKHSTAESDGGVKRLG